MIFSTATYVYGFLLIAIKSDAVTDGGDDVEVTPALNLNFVLVVTTVAPLSKAIFTSASKSFDRRYTSTPSSEGAKPGNEGAEEI